MPQDVQSNGLLSQLVGMKAQKQAQDKINAIQTYKSILDPDSSATEGMRQYAGNSLLGLVGQEFGGGKNGGSGGKGNPVVDLFKHVIGKAVNAGGQKQQQQGQPGFAERPGAPAPDQRFMTRDQMADQGQARATKAAEATAATQAKIDAAKEQQRLQVKRQENQETYETEFKRLTESGMDPARAAEEANAFAAGRAAPAARAAPGENATEKIYMKGPDGKVIGPLRRDPKTGKVYNIANREVDTSQMTEADNPKEPGETGELKTREQAEKIIADPASSAIEKKAAKDTLKHLDTTEKGAETRVVIEQAGAQDKRDQEAAIPDTVDGIMNGTIPPDRAGLGRNAGWLKIQAQLARKGFDLTHAELDWQAAKRYVSSVNSAQQVRLREAASTASQMLTNVNDAYDQWKKAGASTGIKVFNKAALQAAKNLPGKAGVAAQTLDTSINDLVADLGNLYMGGNSPTDKALDLAHSNLSGEWNEDQFKAAVNLLRKNIGYRVNSIMNAGVAGASPDSPYTPQGGGGVKPEAASGTSAPTRTATGPNGEKLGLVNGKWVPLK